MAKINKIYNSVVYFFTIMEHTAKNIETNNGLISSLLKLFDMSELRLNYDKEKLNLISIRCISCKRKNGYI